MKSTKVRPTMRSLRKAVLATSMLAIAATSLSAQKVKIGYDKSVDFQKYSTYVWAKLSTQPARPMLVASVIGAVDNELKSKNLQRRDDAADLIVVPAGGHDFGLNVAADTPVMPGYSGPP